MESSPWGTLSLLTFTIQISCFSITCTINLSLLFVLFHTPYTVFHIPFTVWYFCFYLYRYESKFLYCTMSYFRAETMFYTYFSSLAWDTSTVFQCEAMAHLYQSPLGKWRLWFFAFSSEFIYSFTQVLTELPLCARSCSRLYEQNHQKPVPHREHSSRDPQTRDKIWYGKLNSDKCY